MSVSFFPSAKPFRYVSHPFHFFPSLPVCLSLLCKFECVRVIVSLSLSSSPFALIPSPSLPTLSYILTLSISLLSQSLLSLFSLRFYLSLSVYMVLFLHVSMALIANYAVKTNLFTSGNITLTVLHVNRLEQMYHLTNLYNRTKTAPPSLYTSPL